MRNTAWLLPSVFLYPLCLFIVLGLIRLVARKEATPCPVVSTRAIYSFLGFPEAPVRHLTLQHDGFPTGAAWRFAEAARAAADPSAFLASFVRSQPAAEPLACPDHGGDAEYRYHVQLRGRRSRHLLVQCWRRYPEGIGWQRRCGPMRLECFLRRFLPGS